MTTKPTAFIFDLNGTMVDDMEFHGKAWSSIINDDLKAGLTYEEVKKQMYGKNSELLHRIFGDKRFTPEEEDKLSLEKEHRYQAAYRSSLSLIDGLDGFLEKAKAAGISMAIGSAAIPFNINFVLDGLAIGHYFKAVVSADDVQVSKPHPETFLKAAELLGSAPENCVVFEDAPKGVEAAQNAGMKCVVLTTMHGQEDFSSYTNVIAFISTYNDPALNQLF
ncbi:HAD family hydrolase [Pedobacter metabolipauper]|uniref:HAD superfamily hydrolase (TIGR01509 family)/beta-phosphoglucomutase family hydrolase n=1 Tax=Pedobacter metabolipauper TaxID=425513 RepID=A0A4R6SZU2_9SPHI|nr:HAD family phosphatase [Pedobacter metabolipauper]TDQ11632.1 HAD superfamily hydrolase (TIGR01509 family)/beta-phosphoglucomutase family hydrolase [Pedobacter metabolipauper]